MPFLYAYLTCNTIVGWCFTSIFLTCSWFLQDVKYPIPILFESGKDVPKFSNLKNLDVTLSFYKHNLEHVIKMIHNCPLLKSLRLVHEVRNSLFFYFCNLIHLECHYICYDENNCFVAWSNLKYAIYDLSRLSWAHILVLCRINPFLSNFFLFLLAALARAVVGVELLFIVWGATRIYLRG